MPANTTPAAQATHQAGKPSDEVGSVIAALHELSRRLDRRSDDARTPDAMHPENPAVKFANCLIEQRDVCPAESSRSTRALIGPDPDATQLPPGLIDIPTMLQQFGTSPSSGASWLGLGADRDAAGNDMMSLTQSLLPNARMAGAKEYPGIHGHAMSPGDRDFDFIAELRKMESNRDGQGSPEVWKEGAR